MSTAKRFIEQEMETVAFWHYDKDGNPTPERAAVFESLKGEWERIALFKSENVPACDGTRKHGAETEPLTKEDMIAAGRQRGLL
jgi:hypothetical protein